MINNTDKTEQFDPEVFFNYKHYGVSELLLMLNNSQN